MLKQIVVLVGSPRENGNTHMLADAFIKGALSAGCKVKKVSICDKKILPCLDCKHCYRNVGQCILKDDMQEIYEELIKADVIVLASPVYFYGFSAQLKSCIDRLHNPIRNTFKIKHAALLAVCADDGKETFVPMAQTYQAIIGYLGWQDIGRILIDRVEEKGAVAGRVGLKEAESLGKSVFLL